MSRPTSNGNYGYKVTSRTIYVDQVVRSAEGADWDLPYAIYQFDNGKKFVEYKAYSWTANT